MKTTFLIVPAMTDQAGQCHIVAAEGSHPKALESYRREPSLWRDAGLMNSRGKLVWVENIGDIRQQMLDCEPLMAGCIFEVES